MLSTGPVAGTRVFTMDAMRSPRKLLPVLALAALVGVTAGCSSAEPADEWYTAPPAQGAPAPDQVQADGSVVGAGEWGAVRYLSTDDVETVLAVKTTALVEGEKGAFAVMVPGGGDLSEATAYFVSYNWTNLTGDEDFSPSQNMVAGDPDAMTLSVPESLRGCEPAEGRELGAGLGTEMRGCVVVASTSGPPTSVVFQGPQGSSSDVSFTVPAS